MVCPIWREVGGALLLLIASSFAFVPPVGSRDLSLAQGPFATMHMLLTRTILRVKVLTVDIRFDESTRERIQAVAGNQPYSEPLAERVAGAALQAGEASVQIRFLRGVGLDQFIAETTSAARCAFKSGAISSTDLSRLEKGLPQWFAAIRDRGFKKGDRLSYSVDPHSMHTVMRGADGAVLVDQLDQGTGPRRTLFGSYFARCSDFRDPLVKSLLAREGTS